MRIVHYQWQIQDFPEEGAPTLQGVPIYDFAKYSQKLHEIERIWTPRGGTHPKFYYVDPPLITLTRWLPNPVTQQHIRSELSSPIKNPWSSAQIVTAIVTPLR